MKTKIINKKGPKGPKKGAAQKKKVSKGRNEVSVKFITDIIARHGLDFSRRLQEILKIHAASKPYTYDQFGLQKFVKVDTGKIIGDIQNKRPDLRTLEIGIQGNEAKISKTEVPMHPIQMAAINTLDIIKKGLIKEEQIASAQEFVASDKFATETHEIQLEETVDEGNRILIRNVLQLRTGHDSLVTLSGTKLTIKKFDHKKDKRSDAWLWDKPYVRFVLHRNLRYPSILERAAKHIGIPISKFQRTHLEFCAGYTLQWLQLEKIEPALIKDAFERTMCNVSDFEFTDKPLEEGKYLGFRTKAVIRKLKMTEEEVKAAIESFQTNGYINYFSISPTQLLRNSVQEIGKNIIKNDFFQAGKAIMRPRPVDRDRYEEIKEFSFVAQDPRIIVPAFKFLKLKESTDLAAKLINAMVDNRNGKLEGKFATQAFAKADPAQIMEYTDAFLNWVWNQTVNKLIEKRGLKLAVGDLVFVDKVAENTILYDCPYQSSVLRDSIKEGQKSYKEYVKSLTQQDIDSGKYSIFDLLIPVLGFDVRYPDNDISTIIDEILNKNDISSKDWFEKAHGNTVHGVPVTFRGTYRKVLLRPENLTYKIEKYTDEKLPLFLEDIPSRRKDIDLKKEDAEKKEAKPEEVKAEEKEETTENKDAAVKEEAKEEVKEEEKKPAEPQDALVLDFYIPKGTKTVIALRELFKKNDFGDLAAPFYERIADKNFSSRCKDKLKFLLNHCKKISMSMMRRLPPPAMVGPLMGPPAFMGPPRSLGPDPNFRIQMLEQELFNLKRKTQSLDNVRPLGMQQRGGNRGNMNAGPSPQRQQMQGGQNRKPMQRQNLTSPQKAPQNNLNQRNANNNNQQQQNRPQANNANNRQTMNNNNQQRVGGNANAANNRRPQNNQQQRTMNNQQTGQQRGLKPMQRNMQNFSNNRTNQQDMQTNVWSQPMGNQNFGGNNNRQNMGQNRAQQNQGNNRGGQRNFNNARGGQNQLMQSFNSNNQQAFNNDFSDDFIPPQTKRGRFDNNGGQNNMSFSDDFNSFQSNRPRNNLNNSFGGQNRGNNNNNSNSLFERRNTNDSFSLMGGGNSFNSQNFGGQSNMGGRGNGNLLERPAFMAGANRNNFGGNRRGNFNNF